MMPQLLTARLERPGHRIIRIWVPVLPVALVLSPLLILAALAAVVACRVFRVGVTQAFGSGWRFFCALPGTRFDVRDAGTALLVSIR
jgi:hypothetical protein